jgi:hypothetical protein
LKSLTRTDCLQGSTATEGLFLPFGIAAEAAVPVVEEEAPIACLCPLKPDTAATGSQAPLAVPFGLRNRSKKREM